MKNKTLAIIGIVIYLLGVISSATDLKGNSTAPLILIAVSAIGGLIFVIMATIRLWGEAKTTSILLVSSIVILIILSVVQGSVLPAYGSPIIIATNITKLISFIASILAIIKLFKMKEKGLPL